MKNKLIQYRGGLISFLIPSHREEEYRKEGGGTFYENTEDSGTLRVNVLTLEHNNKNEHPYDSFEKEEDFLDYIEYKSCNDEIIIEYFINTEDSNIPITMYNFFCFHKTKQKDFQIAIFSWTIETRFKEMERYIKDLEEVRQNIINIQFGNKKNPPFPKEKRTS